MELTHISGNQSTETPDTREPATRKVTNRDLFITLHFIIPDAVFISRKMAVRGYSTFDCLKMF